LKSIILLLSLFVVLLDAKDYRLNVKTQEFIQKMVQEHGFTQSYLEGLFKNVQKQDKSLAIVTRKRTKKPSKALKKLYPYYGAWDRYSKYKVTKSRIVQGKKFIQRYRTTFKKVEEKYGVPAEYIAAIIGIESVYGRNVGKHPVFDALSTLAFEKNRRNKFFAKELEKFLLLSRQNHFNPKNVKGSYAGAIGLGQFMPSNYAYYGVDFNQDGKISLQNPVDAIASVANYLKKNGWRRGEPVATRVSYSGSRFKKYKTGYDRTYHRAALKGIVPKKRWVYHDKVRLIKLNREKYDELWYGAKNFYVITRYNHSAYYAMSVHQLAEGIKKAL
jgi:membrane-bound lytic murein transglycosylase B